MRALLMSMIVAAALAGCGKPVPPPPAATLSVAEAWVRLSPVPGRPAAGYFSLTGGATADRLTRIDSDKVATIELHEGGMKNGMMTMKRIADVAVPAGGSVTFAPGGNHAMLFGVDPSVVPGATLPLRLTFASGATLTADARVVAAGADTAAHGH